LNHTGWRHHSSAPRFVEVQSQSDFNDIRVRSFVPMARHCTILHATSTSRCLFAPDGATSPATRPARYPRGRIRMRPGSMTEKWPAQSSRDMSRLLSRGPISPGFGIGKRNSTTPHVLGNADPLASSPKSLSKVSRVRFVACRPREHIWIAHAWDRIPHPHDILPGCNERRHGGTGKILVCKEAHVTLRWGRPFRNSACHGHMRDRP
jgi:hypothetical protein